MSKAAQFYDPFMGTEHRLNKPNEVRNADLAKIDLQYQQSRKKGGKEEDAPEAAAEV